MSIRTALMSVFSTFIFLISLESSYNSEKIKIQPTRIFDELIFSSVEKIVKYGDRYYILESINHRILVFDLSKRFNYQISRIGQEKGELFYPRNFIIRGERLYVNDEKNNRIQIFDLKGNYINDFPDYYNSYGIEVNSKGEIYLGQPSRGKLISVYDKDGKLIDSFGNLHKLSDFYGTSLKKLDRKFGNYINRVNMCIDRSDNLFLSFVGAPFIQKYDRDGNLIFEKKIMDPKTEEIINGFRKNNKSPIRRAIDDVPIPLITTGMAIDNITGHIIIPFQWNRCWIYIATTDGEKVVTLEPIEKDMLFQNISITESFDLILPRLSVIKDNEAYKINIKKFIKRR